MKKILISTSALLLLSACVSQDQADAKMAEGCKAGVQSLIGNASIEAVKSTNYSFEQNDEGQHRRITLEAHVKDGWLEKDEKYSCLFAQDWGFFKSSHTAILVQIKFPDGKIIGKQDQKIFGELSDFLSLSRTVQSAMGQVK